MGFVKNNAIPRFINEDSVVAAIRQIAGARLRVLENERMFASKPAEVLSEFFLLNEVALTVTGRRPVGAEATALALFQADALELALHKCANAYWLWYLLDKVRTAAFPLDITAVARAHARAKDSLYDNRHGFAFISPNSLEHDLKMLPPGFVFEMWHKGRLIAQRTDSGEYPVQLNPLLLED